jgi:hypothetical protein
VRQVDALIRYHLHVDPGSLTDEQWAMLYNDLIWVKRKEREELKNSQGQ